jgi:capsular polysaccharide biosynthesis protein
MDMARFLKTTLKYSWPIVIFGAVAGGLAYLVSSQMPKVYESEARVLVGSLTEPDLQQQMGYQQLARTYASLVGTPIVLGDVVAATDVDDEIEEVAKRVSASTAADESIVRIVASAASPGEAQALAAAVAERFVQLGTPGSLGASAVGAESLARVIQPPVANDVAASPRVTFNAAIAAGVGLALGVLVALLVSMRYDAPRKPVEPAWPEPLGYPASPGPYSR